MKTTLHACFTSIVTIALLLISSHVQSQTATSKSKKDGWAIGMGAGYMYAGNMGVLFERQMKLKERWRLSPFASAGWAEGGTDSLKNRYSYIGLASGINLEFGKKHRAFIGSHAVVQRQLGQSVEVYRDILPGVSLILGYKGTSNWGLIWQIYIGDIYTQEATNESKAFDHYSQVGLGLGYKF